MDTITTLVSGLMMGAVYALIAAGFTLTYRAFSIVNLAHGEVVVIGGLTTILMVNSGIPLPIAAPTAIVLSAAIGLVAFTLAKPDAHPDGKVRSLIILVGFAILASDLAGIVYGRDIQTLPPLSGVGVASLAGLYVPLERLWVMVAATPLLLALWYVFDRSTLAARNGAMHAALLFVVS